MPNEESSVKERKMLLRQEAAQLRSSLPQAEAARRSRKIMARVLALPEVQRARVVSVYCSFGSEVGTHDLIEALAKAGKRVCLPVVDASLTAMTMYEFRSFSELKVCPFGFPEPVPATHQKVEPAEIDVILAPGLAFDEEMHRLGFGMAYYDRYIAGMPKHVPIISLAYEVQIFPQVPVTPKDVPVDKIVTEERVITCSR